MASLAPLVLVPSRVKIELSSVPAWDALMPALAMSPIPRATSSMLYPRAPDAAPTYLKVSPIMLTLVLAFEDATASTSANRPLSFAVIPKAVSASVTMSLVVARLSPEAAARDIMPSIPFSISPVFQPAIAM